MKKLLSGFAIAAAIFLPSLSQATIVVSSTGLSTYDNLVTFSNPSLAQNTIVTNQYAAQGLTFTALNGGAVRANGCGVGGFNSLVGFSGDMLGTFSDCRTNDDDDSFSMKFANSVQAASFGLESNGVGNIFTTFLNGNIVDTYVTTAGINGYLNITNIVFNEIRFTETNITQAAYFAFDNVASVNAVPEPTTVALLGLGLLGFAASRRKAAKGMSA